MNKLTGFFFNCKQITFILCMIVFCACSKNDNSDTFTSDNFSLRVKSTTERTPPITKVSYTKDGNWVVHANYSYESVSNIRSVEDIFISFPKNYRTLTAGNYLLQSSSIALGARQAYIEYTSNYNSEGNTNDNNAFSIDGQLEVSRNNGHIHIVFNDIHVLRNWHMRRPDGNPQNTYGADTLLMYGDITY